MALGPQAMIGRKEIVLSTRNQKTEIQAKYFKVSVFCEEALVFNLGVNKNCVFCEKALVVNLGLYTLLYESSKPSDIQNPIKQDKPY